jgi:hypothetical protein
LENLFAKKNYNENDYAEPAENKKTDPLMRRGFLKAATLLGLGTIAAGTVKGYAATSQSPEKNKT